MPKFIIKSEEDLLTCDYIKRKDLVIPNIGYIDEITGDTYYKGTIKFIGHSHEYVKYKNLLKICGTLEDGQYCNLHITNMPLKFYIIDKQILESIN